MAKKSTGWRKRVAKANKNPIVIAGELAFGAATVYSIYLKSRNCGATPCPQPSPNTKLAMQAGTVFGLVAMTYVISRAIV